MDLDPLLWEKIHQHRAGPVSGQKCSDWESWPPMACECPARVTTTSAVIVWARPLYLRFPSAWASSPAEILPKLCETAQCHPRPWSFLLAQSSWKPETHSACHVVRAEWTSPTVGCLLTCAWCCAAQGLPRGRLGSAFRLSHSSASLSSPTNWES